MIKEVKVFEIVEVPKEVVREVVVEKEVIKEVLVHVTEAPKVLYMDQIKEVVEQVPGPERVVEVEVVREKLVPSERVETETEVIKEVEVRRDVPIVRHCPVITESMCTSSRRPRSTALCPSLACESPCFTPIALPALSL